MSDFNQFTTHHEVQISDYLTSVLTACVFYILGNCYRDKKYRNANKHAILATKGSIKLARNDKILESEQNQIKILGIMMDTVVLLRFKKKLLKIPKRQWIRILSTTKKNNKLKRNTSNSDILDIENYRDLGSEEETEHFLLKNASELG